MKKTTILAAAITIIALLMSVCSYVHNELARQKGKQEALDDIVRQCGDKRTIKIAHLRYHCDPMYVVERAEKKSIMRSMGFPIASNDG